MRSYVGNEVGRLGFTKVAAWGKLISLTGMTQIFVQVLGLICGILIIRRFSGEEYALYTLANSILTSVTVLADSGIGAGVLANGGKVWQNEEKLGGVLAAGIMLRRKFGILILIIAIPVLLYLLIHHDASWGMAILICVSIIPAFFAALSDTLYEIPLKLNQDVASLQKNQLQASISRLGLLSVFLYLIPFSFMAILCSGLSRLWANIKLRSRMTQFVDFTQPADHEARVEIMIMLKRTMPNTIYYCLASQATIWLITIFGNTSSIAHIGALERIVSVINVISVIFSTLVVPRFARLPNNGRILTVKFFQVIGVLGLITISLCSIVFFMSGTILFVLGDNYKNLDYELVLVTIGGCMNLMAGIANYMSVSRGWAISPAIHIVGNISIQILLICLLDLTAMSNIIIVSVFGAASSLFIYCGYFFYKGLREGSRE